MSGLTRNSRARETEQTIAAKVEGMMGDIPMAGWKETILGEVRDGVDGIIQTGLFGSRLQ